MKTNELQLTYQDLVGMADELHTALVNTIDTLLEVYDNGEWCPACGGEYTEDIELLMANHDGNCSLNKAVILYQRITTDGQLKIAKESYEVGN